MQNSGNKIDNNSDKKSNNSRQVNSPKKYLLLLTEKRSGKLLVELPKPNAKKPVKIIIDVS